MSHVKCAHYYCGHCMKKNQHIDKDLEDGCESFSKFNPYEYRSYVKKYKGETYG